MNLPPAAAAAAENNAVELLLMTCEGIFEEWRWITLGLMTAPFAAAAAALLLLPAPTVPAAEAAEAVVVDMNFLAPARRRSLVLLNTDVDDDMVRFVLVTVYLLVSMSNVNNNNMLKRVEGTFVLLFAC